MTTAFPPLYDRGREQQELARAWASGVPELLIAAGRRRAGKSYLLTHALQRYAGFYYQATKATAREQLRTLSEAAADQFADAGLAYGTGFRDWEAFFRFIVERAAGASFFLVLDELPYLLESSRGFATVLQKVWDTLLPRTQIKLVLSGSYISAMRRLTAADQPLHGRRTGRLQFAPFTYLDTARFVPDYVAADRLMTYAIFGGLPGQLALLDPRRSLAENVARHVLDPSGRLADEAEHLFDAFLRDAGVHYAVVRAIAAGEHKWSRITSRVGKDSASLSRPLAWLQEMEVVGKVIPVTDTPPGNPKKTLYRLTDPYLAFWYRFVARVRAAGTVDLLDPMTVWERFVAPALDEYMGPWFEVICRAFVGKNAYPRLPFQPERVGEWWSDDAQNQIDVVALGTGGEVLLGECKWGAITSADVATLEARRDWILRELSGTRRVHLAVFTGAPVTDERLRARIAAGDVLHFTPEDLLTAGRPALSGS